MQKTSSSASRPHAEHSPSSLKNYEACPSYKGRSGTNPIAEAGTRIHEAIENGDPSVLVDEVERGLAEWCLAFLADNRGNKSQSAKLVGTHQEIMLQMRVGDFRTFGTCDLIDLYDDGSGALYDWKTGYGAVEDAEVNVQVQAYAFGVFAKFPDLLNLDCYLVLPRRGEITHARYSREDMDRVRLRIGTIIARAKESAGKVFNPTEGVCDYCANQGNCKALAEKALVIGQKSGFDVPTSISLDGTPADRAKLLKLANLLSSWCDDTKKELLRQALEEGAEIPGYKLDQRRTPRAVDNPLLGYDAIKELVSVEEYLLSCTRVSVPTLEKFVSERAPRGKKAEAKQHLEDLLRGSGALRDEGVIHLLKPIKA